MCKNEKKEKVVWDHDLHLYICILNQDCYIVEKKPIAFSGYASARSRGSGARSFSSACFSGNS